MVAFPVKMGGKLKNHLGTVINTVPAALASILKDMDNALCNLNFFRIKGYAPKVHDFFLKLISLLILLDLLLQRPFMSLIL